MTLLTIVHSGWGKSVFLWFPAFLSNGKFAPSKESHYGVFLTENPVFDTRALFPHWTWFLNVCGFSGLFKEGSLAATFGATVHASSVLDSEHGGPRGGHGTWSVPGGKVRVYGWVRYYLSSTTAGYTTLDTTAGYTTPDTTDRCNLSYTAGRDLPADVAKAGEDLSRALARHGRCPSAG